MKRFAGVLLFLVGSIGAAQAIDSVHFLDLLEQSALALLDYQVRVSQWSAKAGNTEGKIMNYYFGAPNRIRVDVLESTRGAGSTGVLRPDGKIVARSGSKLFGFRFVFDPDHSMVTTNRGRTFEEAALPGIIDRLKSINAQNGFEVRRVDSRFVVRFRYRESQSGTAIEEIVEFDAETLLPLESRTLESESLVEYVLWTNYATNSGIPSQVFDVRLRQAALEKLVDVDLPRIPITNVERLASRVAID